MKKLEIDGVTMATILILAVVIVCVLVCVAIPDRAKNKADFEQERAMQIYGECQELRGELKAYRAMAVIPSKEAK